MTAQLPEDANGNPIPALRLKDAGAHKIDVSAISTKNVTPFDAETQIISVYASEDVYIKLGDNSVTATNTDHFLPAQIYYDLAIGPNDSAQNAHMAALAVGTDCTLYISEKE